MLEQKISSSAAVAPGLVWSLHASLPVPTIGISHPTVRVQGDRPFGYAAPRPRQPRITRLDESSGRRSSLWCRAMVNLCKSPMGQLNPSKIMASIATPNQQHV